jgi:hypothetical protein
MYPESLPNFFIIGAAKSATTTLYRTLNKHPDVYLPFAKETAFFSRDEFFEKGIGWYMSTFFRGADNYPARGEASPYYLYWGEKVVPRILECLDEIAVKFVAIFRDPVARAYSHYWHSVREGREALSFKEALEREGERLCEHWPELRATGALTYGYYRGGCYATLLKPFLHAFPREQFFFLLNEDLRSDYDSAISGLLAFLRVRNSGYMPPAMENVASLPRSARFHRFLRERSWIKEPFKAILPFQLRHALKSSLIKMNLRRFRYPPWTRRWSANSAPVFGRKSSASRICWGGI